EKNWKSIREAILANKIESKPTPLTMSEFMKVTVTMITEFDIPHQFRSIKRALSGSKTKTTEKQL
ncbi:hypothetical protein KAZ92_00775, partial [Candidatus Gracilibacteria bacterium]|nr:hypothetical protein [Candidatus Gracilibacteria bacterium]